MIERLAASLAGHYRLEQELGQGGMATVYLAHDLKHDRDVAIKVLHPDLGAALGGERFLSEIRTTARLQHPHILPLLDSGEADALLYYVMPVVTGETLRARLQREKQLPIPDAVRIAREVASALDYAHRQGVIHRDIKPENVLLHDGSALVADFGIALAVQTAGGQRMTQTGLSLGTPKYMSPEQAMGERDLDARSDVYALGAVTYEMLTGEPPFSGATVQAVVAKVLSAEPERPTLMRKTIPPGVEQAVLTALAKLPADRFATAAEFATALDERPNGAQVASVASANARGDRARSRATLVLATTLVACALAAGWLLGRRSSGGTAASSFSSVARFELPPPPGYAYNWRDNVTNLGLSPDGRTLVFAVETSSGTMLAVRPIDQLTVRVLPGTTNVTYAAFSPDGRWIAFDANDGFIKKIAVDGSSLTTICPTDTSAASSGIAWLSDKELVFTGLALTGDRAAYRVAADGGTPRRAVRLDSANGDRFQSGPVAVGDGRHLFVSSTRNNNALNHVALLDLQDSTSTVFPTLGSARVVGFAHGAVVYVQPDGALMAAPINLSARTAGAPIRLGDSVVVRRSEVGAALSASGSLLYLRGTARRQLVRVTESGVATPLLDAELGYAHPRLSPDGRRVAFEVGEQGLDIWVADVALQTVERITKDGTSDRPEWSPDGRRVLYSSSRVMPHALWEQPADGSGAAVKLFQLGNNLGIREGVYAPDGRSIAYRVDTEHDTRDILMLPLEGERTPVPLVVGPSDDTEPRISPDGKWLAYVSNESGREEVYVRPYAPSGGRVAVSSGGGGEPLWSRDGRRLFYRNRSKLMAANITTSPQLVVGARALVFEGPYEPDGLHPNYDVLPDGKGFVMVRKTDEARRIVLVINGAEELRQRLGGAK